MDKFLQKLIVYAYQKIGNQRSIRSFYFILIGKRSLQATQDARLFGLEKFYGTLPLLDYDRYEKCFHAAKESKYTQLNIEDAWFYQQLYDYEINRKSMYFMERIQLLIQVLSHLKRKDVCYIPMCKRYETQKFIKQFLKQNFTRFPNIYERLFNEYYTLLLQIPEVNREILLGTQMGYKALGETIYQLSERINLSQTEIWIHICASGQFLFQQVRNQAEQYPLLSGLLPTLDMLEGCTESARKTKMWIERGKTIEEISQIRHMKRGTIESHIIEIAMHHPHFSIATYLPEDKMQRILACVHQKNSFRLKELKEDLGADFSYFEIRLALTKVGV